MTSLSTPLACTSSHRYSTVFCTRVYRSLWFRLSSIYVRTTCHLETPWAGEGSTLPDKNADADQINGAWGGRTVALFNNADSSRLDLAVRAISGALPYVRSASSFVTVYISEEGEA